MNDLRYPLGPMPMPQKTTAEDRALWIEQIAALPDEVEAAAQGVTEAELETAYRESGWTLRQVVHHIADSHMNGFIRLKLALTEDQPLVKTYDEAQWAKLADVACDIEVSIRLLRVLHERWTAVWESLSDADFARTFQHPENGLTRLDQHLAIYAWHGRHHVEHIKAARAAARERA
jgi:hypothetical protein